MLAQRIILAISTLLLVFTKSADAALSACSATVDPSTTNVNTDDEFSVRVINDDDSNGRMSAAGKSIELTFIVSVILIVLSIFPIFLVSRSLANQLK